MFARLTSLQHVDGEAADDAPEDEDVEDGEECEGDEVEEDEVHPRDVDLDVVRILAQTFYQSP